MSSTDSWLNNASEYHQKRMLSLASREDLIGSVRGVKDKKYMMYRHSVIDSPDDGRKYEFLIEYDIFNPSQGIYLGCKSVTLPGFSHNLQIAHAIDDWEKLHPFALQRLNNIFVNKDFTHRFRQTDNAHNGTFWPFWISLYEDEDPREVGCRILEITSGVYKDYFSGRLPQGSPKISTPKILNVETAFTFDAFENFKEKVKKILRRKTAIKSAPDNGWSMIEKFLEEAEKHGWFRRLRGYEAAWCINEEYGDVDFHFIIKYLFERIGEKYNIPALSPPWTAITGIFMRHDETIYKSQIKTLSPAAPVRNYWRDELKKLELE
ncbi:MAG: hypothetical protein K2K58_03415 [Muribaculaceae bacterium]|nr:hypothetical protein [Muribaculaceae bacterium]